MVLELKLSPKAVKRPLRAIESISGAGSPCVILLSGRALDFKASARLCLNI